MGKTYKDKKGYPRWKDSGKFVHRTVASNKVRGPIGKGRVVHHKDGNKSNFRKSNLTIMSRSTHSKLHKKKKRSWI
ncbi:MAG: HNH endonuclease [Candidatus Bathyarchaeota archaeon]|nr:MAG: HNH endonuclease [Candidatus Bathyarchaeota archaeon]